jgi:hypothetical protein
VRRLAAVLIVCVAAAACGVGAGRSAPVTFPPQSFGAAGSPTPAMQQARNAVTAALGGFGIIVDEPQSPYRPAETRRFAGAPRAVIRAVLPRDPERGLISIYGFVDPASARQAAREQAAYVASPVGRVQFPTGTQFTIRQFGSAVVFFSEVPGSSPDDQAPDVAEALRSVGEEVEVPG